MKKVRKWLVAGYIPRDNLVVIALGKMDARIYNEIRTYTLLLFIFLLSTWYGVRWKIINVHTYVCLWA